MNYIILIIAGIAGVILGTYLGRRRKMRKMDKPLDYARGKENKSEDQKKKEENLQKIRELFNARERLANNDIENLLAVSDATATRYLDELEKEGYIRQVGKTGRFVYYERV